MRQSLKDDHAKRRKLTKFILVILFWGISVTGATGSRGEQIHPTNCETLGWFPEDFGLKDHSVFFYDGYYYLVSIYLPGEKYFAYARSLDLCEWENLSPILSTGAGSWDNLAIWAPYVFVEDGVYYLYYTGVNGPYPHLTQTILLATSENPSDPTSWTADEDFHFQPDHPDMIWENNTWADCRDPMVLKDHDTYYLYYTGKDISGGIIGVAQATSPLGPWTDFGKVVNLDSSSIPESATVWPYNRGYYIFYHRMTSNNSMGEKYRFGMTPMGPWGDETSISPGWAHEIWAGMDGKIYTSYLTDYSVTIDVLLWNTQFSPPRPSIGDYLINHYIPLIRK